MRDGITHIKPAVALAPVAATTAQTGAAVDLRGCDSASFIITVDNAGDTLSASVNWAVSFEAADADASGNPVNWSAVDAKDVIGDTLITAKNAQYKTGVLTIRRFVRLKLTPGGTHSSGNGLSAVAVLGRLSAQGKVW